MKKLLMALTVTTALAFGSQAFADCGCGCDFPKDECGCKKPACERCGDRTVDSCCDYKNKSKEEMYCRLNLDSCQRQQADEIDKRYESDIDCIKDKIKDDHKALCDKLHASCLDKSAVRNQERILKDDFKDLKSKLKEIDKDFKAILKCDQKKEYRVIKREMKYRAKHSMKYCCKPSCKR